MEKVKKFSKGKISIVFLLFILFIISSSKFVQASNGVTVYNKGEFKVYLDSPDSAKPYYHLHFYKKGKHVYCLRLDNFKYCDGKNNRKAISNKVYSEVMAHPKVKRAVLHHNPNVKKSPSYKAVVKAGAVTLSAILIILAAINVFTGPADDAVAWAAFLRALAI